MMKAHQAVQFNTIYYDENGSETFSECSIANIYEGGFATQYEDSNGYAEFTSGDRTSIFDPEDNSFTVHVYVDNQLNVYLSQFKDSIFYVSEDETLVSSKTDKGLTTVTTEKPVGADTEYLSGYFDADNYDTIKSVYECDAKTLEIKSLAVSASGKNTDLLICNSTYTYSNDRLTTPGFVSDLNNADKMRVVTLHYNSMSQYNIAQEARFGFDVPDGYGVFADADGKKPLKDYEKAGKDMEIYLLKLEESTTEKP